MKVPAIKQAILDSIDLGYRATLGGEVVTSEGIKIAIEPHPNRVDGLPYPTFWMSMCGKRVRVYIHQFVAYYFHRDDNLFEEGYEVSHLNNDPTDNRPHNLKIVLKEENVANGTTEWRMMHAHDRHYMSSMNKALEKHQIIKDYESGMSSYQTAWKMKGERPDTYPYASYIRSVLRKYREQQEKAKNTMLLVFEEDQQEERSCFLTASTT
jgi:hypothetical protein